MRSWSLTASIASLAAASAVVAGACSSDYGVAPGEGGSSSGTSGSSALPQSDGGSANGGVDGGVDGDAQADDGHCALFTDGNMGGFVAEGSVTPGSAGVTLQIGEDRTTIRRTYRASKPIARSRLSITLLLNVSGNWPDGNTGVGVLSLFYGAGTSEEETTTTRLSLRKNDVEIAVWPTPTVSSGTKPVNILHWGNAFTTASVVTEWGQPGSVAVDIGVFGGKFVGDTASKTSDELTVVFGGKGTEKTPTVTLTIQRVCVELL